MIKKQLCDDVIVWEEFDVGYINNEKAISIRTADDLQEVWKEIKAQDDKMQLWCDGLKTGQPREEQTRKKRKRVNSDDDDSDDDHPKKSAREQRDEKLKQAVETLNEKHGSNYTTMQYHIWSELYASCMQMVCIWTRINHQTIQCSRELDQAHPPLRKTNLVQNLLVL